MRVGTMICLQHTSLMELKLVEQEHNDFILWSFVVIRKHSKLGK